MDLDPRIMRMAARARTALLEAAALARVEILAAAEMGPEEYQPAEAYDLRRFDPPRPMPACLAAARWLARQPQMRASTEHAAWMVYDDDGLRAVCYSHDRGTDSRVMMDAAKMIHSVQSLGLGPAGIIAAHNHPSGNPWPSPGDWRAHLATRDRLAQAGIVLEDSLVITLRAANSANPEGTLTLAHHDPTGAARPWLAWK